MASVRARCPYCHRPVRPQDRPGWARLRSIIRVLLRDLDELYREAVGLPTSGL